MRLTVAAMRKPVRPTSTSATVSQRAAVMQPRAVQAWPRGPFQRFEDKMQSQLNGGAEVPAVGQVYLKRLSRIADGCDRQIYAVLDGALFGNLTADLRRLVCATGRSIGRRVPIRQLCSAGRGSFHLVFRRRPQVRRIAWSRRRSQATRNCRRWQRNCRMTWRKQSPMVMKVAAA